MSRATTSRRSGSRNEPAVRGTLEVVKMPDRLPSLIVLVGFWVPPAVAGWVAAWHIHRSRGARRDRPALTYAALTAFVLAYAVGWFFFNLHRMPPYIPGSTMDPTFASPQAAAWL